jgi:hypothetical protein
MTIDDEDEIPFDPTPIYWVREPSEMDLRAAGYEVLTVFAFDCDAYDLNNWHPPLPDELSAEEGWYLAAKRYEALPVETEYGDDGEILYEHEDIFPLAVWARRPTATTGA